MVSNCYTASRREQYVLDLQKYISVDVYGNCENAVPKHYQLLSCPKQLDEQCWNMIDQKYKVRLFRSNNLNLNNCVLHEKLCNYKISFFVIF